MADDSVLEQAIILHSAGFPVILTDHQKNPGFVGGEWHNYKWNAKKFAAWLQTRPNLQLGLKLWPIIDVEIDAPEGDDGSFVKEATLELRDLAGYTETPSWTSRRGRHWLYRVTDAQRERLEELECPAVVKSGRLEFRLGCGKAAQSLIPPSTTDEFQRQWVQDIATVAILTMPDRMFDLIEQEAVERLAKAKTEVDDDSVGFQRPGDVFNEQATWDDILVPHGWREKGDGGDGVRYWLRPGKSDGVSATTGYCKSTLRDDCFYSFSTAAEIAPFEAQRSYSKFEAFAFLEFDGDFAMASAELVRRGYKPEGPDGSEFESLPDEEPAVEEEAAPAPLNTPRVSEAAPPKKPPRKPPSVITGSLPLSIYNNPIGRYVLANDPHTEADRDAVLLQSWELFGNFIGREVQFALNNNVIYPNGYTAIIGRTSMGRKGTSLNDALAPYKFNEPELELFLKAKHKGVSTGEGIINKVADRPENFDGRFFGVAEELHRLMTAMKRPENILSSVLREAYDGGVLSVVTKTNPLVASNAHVSMVIHATAAEFSRHVDNIDIYNGVLNRFLFFNASDGKVLPNPGNVDPAELELLSKHLVKCRDWVLARPPEAKFYWSEDARGLWEPYYSSMRIPTNDELRDSVLARGNTHIIKMAMRHAVLDMSDAIQLDHLQSAITIWEVCRECAVNLLVTQNTMTDDKAKLLDVIRDSDGFLKTEGFRLFGSHVKASELEGHLNALVAEGFVKHAKISRKGRKYNGYVAV